jgi:hypothetical protein
MLRIIQSESASGRRWILCGQLAGRWVDELLRQWKNSPGASAVDLSDVTFIDEAGEALLARMKNEGLDLLPSGGVATRDLLENICTDERRPVRRMLGRSDET